MLAAGAAGRKASKRTSWTPSAFGASGGAGSSNTPMNQFFRL